MDEQQAEMVQDGLAWHHKQYSKSKELAETENKSVRDVSGWMAAMSKACEKETNDDD